MATSAADAQGDGAGSSSRRLGFRAGWGEGLGEPGVPPATAGGGFPRSLQLVGVTTTVSVGNFFRSGLPG